MMVRALAPFIALVLALVLAPPLAAVTPGEQLADPAKETRARRLSAELRCLVCQNQSIDDSDAALAVDLRRLVRERITAGDDDAAIRAFLVARYGEFVLLNPPLSTRTILLWSLPGLALILGGIAALGLFRRRDGEAAQEAVVQEAAEGSPVPLLSEDERREIAAMLDRRAKR